MNINIPKAIVFGFIYILLIATSYWGCAVYEWKFNPGEWQQSTRQFFVFFSSIKTGILGVIAFVRMVK